MYEVLILNSSIALVNAQNFVWYQLTAITMHYDGNYIYNNNAMQIYSYMLLGMVLHQK